MLLLLLLLLQLHLLLLMLDHLLHMLLLLHKLLLHHKLVMLEKLLVVLEHDSGRSLLLLLLLSLLLLLHLIAAGAGSSLGAFAVHCWWHRSQWRKATRKGRVVVGGTAGTTLQLPKLCSFIGSTVGQGLILAGTTRRTAHRGGARAAARR